MTDLEQLTDSVEKDLLFYIITHMRESKITMGQAQNLARDFLAILPAVNKEDFLGKINTLGEKYPEAKSVYLKHAAPYEDEKAKAAVSQMQQLIRGGKVEEALEVARKAA
ncbi:MAG: hypothetical protein NUV69_03420 [Candidatus Curtissbacteria bacterium]|nr:hypothetical protein [Candidatus Curtissbacteria bacterium]